MKNNYFQYYKPNLIIGFIVVLGTILGTIITSVIKFADGMLDISYYQYTTASVAVALLVVLIDKKLWNKWPFKFLFRNPDISGRYEGKISYTHPETQKKESKFCSVEIIQSGSKVKANCYFQKNGGKEKTPSNSLVETVKKNDDDSYSLIFTYKNEGFPGLFPEHHGTNILKIIDNDDGRFLKGIYYTNREPFQTRGTMEVKFITKHIKNDY